MKVKELKSILKELKDNDELFFRIQPYYGGSTEATELLTTCVHDLPRNKKALEFCVLGEEVNETNHT